MTSSFSAKAPMLGYIYQARYSLYLILSGDDTSQLGIEGLDDVVFEENGELLELLQLKHHLNNSAPLTDTSPDLWRTLRIWSTHVAEKRINLPNTQLTLITTRIAPEGTVAAMLRRPSSQSDTELIARKLIEIADSSSNEVMKPAFAAFKGLTLEDQLSLVGSIRVLDGSPGIEDVITLNKRLVELATRKQYLDALYERLEGWWFGRVIRYLAGAGDEPIERFEVVDKIRDIAEQFGDEVLPVDYWDLQPPDLAEGVEHLFVLQLKQIALVSKRIEYAILDYYRAFEQRSRWAREDLLGIDELERYERRLLEEWDRMCLKLHQDSQDGNGEDEESLRRLGRQIYDWMELQADVRIRPRMAKDYIMRGSYHMLADQKRVWWHPKFLERLNSILTVPVN